jgi:hypothetical protein
MIRRLWRALFYVGRHHVDRAGAVSVAAIAARIRREEADRTAGSGFLTIDVDTSGLSAGVRRALLGPYTPLGWAEDDAILFKADA